MPKTLLRTLLFTATMLAGCASSPDSEYFILSSGVDAAPSGRGPALGIGPITIPEYLNRAQIVSTEQANRVTLHEYQRWAEPVLEGIPRVLAINLASLLNSNSVSMYPWPRNQQPDFAIRVNILQFHTAQQQAKLLAEWHVYDQRSGVETGHDQHTYAQALPGYDGASVAAALSTLLMQLSEDIAATFDSDH